MVKYTKHTLSSGKEIHVYDSLLPLGLRDKVFSFVSNSKFVIGWGDGAQERALKHKFLHSQFNDEDNENCGLLPFLKTTAVNDFIKDLTVKKSMINLSVPSDTNFAHAHPEKIVVLYYVNMDWEQHWHGETLFYTEDLSDIEIALKYTPGRVIVFDATIPHSIRPQSTSADNYRFTYALTFE
jgi:hypothetical protein